MKGSALAAAAAFLLLALALAAKPTLLTLPPVPAQAAAGAFDTPRAIARLKRVLGDQQPHPIDSAASDGVRARLLAELRGIGLAPIVTDGIGCNGDRRKRDVACGRTRNVRATIGPAAGRHVLLVSHYDSTPVGPGAADDGIGVAVMLETAAILKDRPLARPVTFLFDEGEELGLNGARAFLDRDPIASRVDSAINFESRGVTGPAIMFETSRPNGAAISWFGSAAWRPVANSMTADFYAMIPNDTDVSVFKARDWTILNFAVIGNETRYHSPGDTIAALDPRSVRHMGEQALRAASAMAASVPAGSGNLVYADLLGRGIIALPWPAAAALLAMLLVAAAALAWRRRGGLGRSLAAVLGGIGATAAATFLLAWICARLRDGDYWRAHPGTIALAVDLTALAAVTIAFASIRSDVARARIAYWFLFLLAGAGLSLFAPGASIFFLVPPAVLLAGAALEPRLAGSETTGAWLAWLALFLSWAPLLQLMEMLLDFHAPWIFAAFAAIIVAPALIELRPALAALPRAALLVPVVAALATWSALLARPAYSNDRKQPFGLEYVRDGGSARWMAVNDGAALPAGYGRFREGKKVAWSTRKRWAAPAPLVESGMPAIERLSERRHPLGRIVTLRLHAGGNDALLLSGGKDSAFLAAEAGGAIARFGPGKAKDDYRLRCAGRSCDGLVVRLLIGRSRPVEARLIGFRFALPAAAAPLLAARPRTSAPQYTPDQTVSVASVRL
jgi:hypothetical protein